MGHRTTISILTTFSKLRCEWAEMSDTLGDPFHVVCGFWVAAMSWHISCLICGVQLHALEAFKDLTGTRTEQLGQNAKL
jgi:hypothetical protein